MGQYLPFAGGHSIQEAVVGVHFHRKPDSKAVGQARDTAQAELADVLPKAQEFHQVEEINLARIGQDAVSQGSGSPRLAGFERSKVKADATPGRVLLFLENILTVNFLDYPGWDETLKDSLVYLRTVLPPLNLAANPVVAVSLRYVDRYTFDGPDDASDAKILLKKTSVYVTPYSFLAGPFWHSHSGWFEPLEGGDGCSIRSTSGVLSSIRLRRSPSITMPFAN